MVHFLILGTVVTELVPLVYLYFFSLFKTYKFGTMKTVVICAISVIGAVKALEPFSLPPIAFQPTMQAGLPSEVHVNYDVPSFGVVAELAELKKSADRGSSFLKKTPLFIPLSIIFFPNKYVLLS